MSIPKQLLSPTAVPTPPIAILKDWTPPSPPQSAPTSPPVQIGTEEDFFAVLSRVFHDEWRTILVIAGFVLICCCVCVFCLRYCCKERKRRKISLYQLDQLQHYVDKREKYLKRETQHSGSALHHLHTDLECKQKEQIRQQKLQNPQQGQHHLPPTRIIISPPTNDHRHHRPPDSQKTGSSTNSGSHQSSNSLSTITIGSVEDEVPITTNYKSNVQLTKLRDSTVSPSWNSKQPGRDRRININCKSIKTIEPIPKYKRSSNRSRSKYNDYNAVRVRPPDECMNEMELASDDEEHLELQSLWEEEVQLSEADHDDDQLSGTENADHVDDDDECKSSPSDHHQIETPPSDGKTEEEILIVCVQGQYEPPSPPPMPQLPERHPVCSPVIMTPPTPPSDAMPFPHVHDSNHSLFSLPTIPEFRQDRPQGPQRLPTNTDCEDDRGINGINGIIESKEDQLIQIYGGSMEYNDQWEHLKSRQNMKKVENVQNQQMKIHQIHGLQSLQHGYGSPSAYSGHHDDRFPSVDMDSQSVTPSHKAMSPALRGAIRNMFKSKHRLDGSLCLNIEEAKLIKGPNVERLLSDKDFHLLFGMDKKSFYGMKPLQRTNLKMEVGLL